MAENAYVVTVSGQEVQQNDLNQIGSTSGLADDRVFAEILRLVPYSGTVAKAIMPGGRAGAPAATVIPSGLADGGVLIQPFRAVVGSRAAVNASPGGITTDSDALANWRDIRSGVFVGSTTTLNAEIILAPNASGNPRWDLIYASITPDAAGPSVDRRLKDPTTGAITVGIVPAYDYSPVTVAAVTGTAGASPALPATPADGSGQYNIPLAYVRVPNGFTAASRVVTRDIRSTTNNGVADFVNVRGGFDAKPCNANNDANAAFSVGSPFTPFGWNPTSSSVTRPGPWLPPDWRGGHVFLAQFDLLNGSSANWSHQNGGIVDSSQDWRNRVFKVTGTWGVFGFGTDQQTTAGTLSVPFAVQSVAPTVCLSNSFEADGDVVAGASTVWMNSMFDVGLVVSQATGQLLLFVVGTPTKRVFVWIEVTAQFPNA